MVPAPDTRTKVISAALELLERKGYATTTMDEVVSLAGVSKGSVYHAFKSKEALALAALDEFYERGVAIISSGAFMHASDPVARAYGLVDHTIDKAQELWAHGCLIGNIAVGASDSNPAITRRTGELFAKFERTAASIFAAALEARNLPQEKAADLAKLYLITIEGGLVLAEAHADIENVHTGLAMFRDYLACVFNTA